MKWVLAISGGLLGTLLNVTQAHAHFQAAGLGNFNAGALHPLLTVQHALALIAFGLLCGQRGAALLRFGLPGLAGGLVLGLAAANLGASVQFIPPALTVFAALAGLCVAANYVMPASVCISLGMLIGSAIGLDSNPETVDVLARAAGIGGTVIGVLLLFLNPAGLAAFSSAPWQEIGVRVVGSWTSAAAFLNIALFFRK